jgi:uncharacterized protein YjbI with pentapeptide repeats
MDHSDHPRKSERSRNDRVTLMGDMANAILDGADLADRDLRGTSFDRARLRGASFQRARAGIKPAIGSIYFAILMVLWVVSALTIALFRSELHKRVSQLRSAEEAMFIAGLIVAGICVFFFSLRLAGILAGALAYSTLVSLFVTILIGGIALTCGGAVLSGSVALFYFGVALVFGILLTATALVSSVAAGVVMVAITITCSVLFVPLVISALTVSIVDVYIGWDFILFLGLTFLLCYRVYKGDDHLSAIRQLAIRLTSICGTRFRNAQLTGASFEDAVVACCDFRNAELSWCSWRNAKGLQFCLFTDARMKLSAYRNLLTSGTANVGEYSGFDFHNMDLSHMSFVEANLSFSTLRGTLFRESNLERASLRGCRLEHVDCSGATLTGLDLGDAIIGEGSLFRGIKCDYVYLLDRDHNQLRFPESPSRFAEGHAELFLESLATLTSIIAQTGVDGRAFLRAYGKFYERYPEMESSRFLFNSKTQRVELDPLSEVDSQGAQATFEELLRGEAKDNELGEVTKEEGIARIFVQLLLTLAHNNPPSMGVTVPSFTMDQFSLAVSTGNPIDVFITCAPRDEPFQIELEKHLRPLQERGIICGASESLQTLLAGSNRGEWLNGRLSSADVILPLISSDFCSDHIGQIEDIVKHRKVKVVPIIVRACEWRETVLADFSELPTNGIPVEEWEFPHRAYVNIVKGVKGVLRAIRGHGVVPGAEQNKSG